MSEVNADSQTTYANLDWEAYTKARPAYPSSLKNLIYSYRYAHPSAGWERLLDVGAGVGLALTLFAADFKIVHLLDPGPKNHIQARDYLGKWFASHSILPKLELTQATAEAGQDHIHQEADLLICAETAHFLDPDAFVRSAAHMLRPGGTLAVYTYFWPVFPGQSKEFHEAFVEAVVRSLLLCIPAGDETMAAFFLEVFRRTSAGAGKGLLDSLPLPEQHFTDIRRIHINPGAEEQIIKAWKEVMPRELQLPYEVLPSQVGKGDIRVSYDSGKDPEGEGWAFQTTNEWLHGFMNSLRPDVALSEQEHEAAYGRWDRVFAAECPSGSTMSVWPVNLVMATRK